MASFHKSSPLFAEISALVVEGEWKVTSDDTQHHVHAWPCPDRHSDLSVAVPWDKTTAWSQEPRFIWQHITCAEDMCIHRGVTWGGGGGRYKKILEEHPPPSGPASKLRLTTRQHIGNTSKLITFLKHIFFN
jgi:hypothetical protein